MMQTRPIQAYLIFTLFLLSSLPAMGAECAIASPTHSVALVELYTSEGCSSCPPADRWLSTIASGFTPEQVIPLAFHVDYWDDLGWRDRFANPAYSQRQRRQVSLHGGATVYTPQVMLNGKDYRGWLNAARFARDIAAINGKPSAVSLRLTLDQTTAEVLTVTASAEGVTEEAVLYLALYENDLNSPVAAGENRGAHLHHDHVVRRWLGPFSIRGMPQRIALDGDWKMADLGVVAFVENRRSGEVLQAVAGKLCG